MNPNAIPRAELEAEFVQRLQERWKNGAAQYGDASFRSEPIETVQQILDEVEDIAGWAFVLWVQLRLRLGRVLQAEIRLRNKPAPVHCPLCAAERGVAIPAACPHVPPPGTCEGIQNPDACDGLHERPDHHTPDVRFPECDA